VAYFLRQRCHPELVERRDIVVWGIPIGRLGGHGGDFIENTSRCFGCDGARGVVLEELVLVASISRASVRCLRSFPVKYGCVGLEMGLDDLGEGLLHAIVVGLQVFDSLLDCGNERFLAVSSHFGVHAVAFTSGKEEEDEEDGAKENK